MKRQRIVRTIVKLFLITAILAGISSVPADQADEGVRQTLIYGSPDHPSRLDFAGEKVPMDLFWVREAYDRELLINAYWHSSTLQLLKRSARYFPDIERILEEEGIPDDFKYLAMAESNLMQAVSPSGARGIWQFMERTAREYGLRVDEYVDQRYDLEASTRAACRYLSAARDTFGSWTLAAAAYNAGPNGIRKAMDAQGAESYYDLVLNSETARYIFRILAMKTIMKAPEHYGFKVEPHEAYPPVQARKLEIDTAIGDLAAFARRQGISFRTLKELNPWMRADKLPDPGRRPYAILIPENEGKWYR